MKCNPHPDAPHGFLRNNSHNEGRYVCECEHWEEPKMNDRLKELAIEAGYLPDSFGIGHWDMPECKKFAELIVREVESYIEEAEGDIDLVQFLIDRYLK